MKRIFLLLISLLFLFSCLKKKNNISQKYLIKSKNQISLQIIENKFYDNKGKIIYQIKNNSGKKVYVPLINDFIQKVRDTLDNKLNDNFYIYFFDKNQNYLKANYAFHDNFGKVNKLKDTISSYLQKQDSIIFEKQIYPNHLLNSGLLENLKYNLYKKDSRILFENQIIIDTAFINLNSNVYNFLYAGDINFYDSIILINSELQLILKIDSNQIKKRLLPKDLDSLRRNNIEILDGIIYSNKIPIKFK